MKMTKGERLVAEMLGRPRIDVEDVAVRIRDDNGVIHAAEELAEKRTAVFGDEY